MKKIAVLCYGNRGYFLEKPYAPIAALHSFKKVFGNVLDYFCVSKFKNGKDITFIERMGHKPLDVDYSHTFNKGNPESSWGAYPSEGFWAGMLPEKMLKLGYDYSLIVDGDIYCNRKFPFDILSDKTIDFFGVNHPKLHNNDEDKLNAGVLFFNNANCAKKHLSKKYIELYHENDYWSEQPLFQDIIKKGVLSFRELSRNFNLMLRRKDLLAENKEFDKNIAYIVHFLKGKPWLQNTPDYFKYENRQYFVTKFLDLYQELNLSPW